MRAILFDFDGTLVDTFDGIVEGVQRMRARLDAPPLPTDEIRSHIGWGLGNLVGQSHPQLDPLRPDKLPTDGGPLPLSADDLRRVIALFRAEYARVLMLNTRPYPGIPSLCRRLVSADVPLGVVSNKPERFTRQILAALGMADPFAIVLGGDSLPRKKPDPLQIHHAAEILDISAAECVMVGDSALDVQAAQAAGAISCAVTWGLTPEDDLRALRPTWIVHSTEELGARLDGR